MTPTQWKQKYDTDPAFRLERLLILKKRYFKKHGIPNARAAPYTAAIAEALRTTEGDAS